MIFNNLSKKITITIATVAVIILTAGCSLINEDPEPCPAGLNVKFQFNYTLDRGEVLGKDFAKQVRSVNVWAFDQQGNFVWSGSASGSPLESADFQLETPLGEGTYDFVAWCGLDGNEDFTLATYTPANMEELEVKLNTVEKEGLNVSASHFKSLFYGKRTGVEHKINPYEPSVTTVTIPLIKDTNDIAVMLVNEDGTALKESDFTVSFTYADSWLAWDNAVMGDSPTVTYKPWSVFYGETTKGRAEGDAEEDNNPTRSSLLYEMSVSRLMVNGEAYLDVVRNTDGVRIIHLQLIQYFIYSKGNRFDEFTDQQYLDRGSDWNALFFIDNNLNWYRAAGIYINGWAAVPPQSSEQ